MMTHRQGFQFDLNETFPHLDNAPIVEAVIHWQARSETQLQRDELRKALTDRLPEYPECRDQQKCRLESQFDADGDSTQIRCDRWHGFRLNSADQRQIAQFNRDGLVFSRLQPYEDWETFSEEGRRLWEVFREIAEPVEVQRLGVRFINRIALGEMTDMEEYLANAPQCVGGLGLPMNEFLYRSLYEVPEHPYRINVVQTIQPPIPPQTEGFGLILDTDVFTTQAFPCDEQPLQDHLTKMHWLKNKVFFSQLEKTALQKFTGSKL